MDGAEGHFCSPFPIELPEPRIKENGILTSVIVRKDRGDLYEMISDHRRLHAAKIAGLETISANIKEMDDEAVIYMVDSNLQREEILDLVDFLNLVKRKSVKDPGIYCKNVAFGI